MHAHLPALDLLIVISIAAAGLFIVNIWRRGWVFPIIAVGLWGFISIVVGTIYPAVIQKFSVQPNELTKEQPYIVRNIAATREAFGLSNISTKTFNYDASLSTKDAGAAKQTLDNARLYDPLPAQDAFKVTQEITPFYSFTDVDVDRYKIGDDPTQPVLASVRELDLAHLPDNSWTSQHLVYTHGFGAVAAAANQVNTDQPSYVLSGHPAHGRAPEQPRSGTHRRVLRRRSRRLRDRRHQGRRAGSHEHHGCHEGHDVSGQGRSEGLELPAQERAGVALRRLEPVGLGPADQQLACHLHPRHEAACADDRAVPEARRRPVPGDRRRAHPVGARRVHDDQRLPLFAVDPPVGAGRQRSRHRHQLRAQLGEGHRRRVRRHRALLRRRPDRPDHQDVPQGVPRALPGHLVDAGRPAGAHALPGRHLQCADRAVRAVPHHRSGPVLQQAGHLGRRAEPRHVERGAGRHRGCERQQRRAQHDAPRVGQPDRSALSHDGVTERPR